MNILIAVVIPCYMATPVRSLPLPAGSALVDDPQSQEQIQQCRGLMEKVQQSIPDAHKSSIRSQGLQLNSTENGKFGMMAKTIGIPSAPVLKVVSDDFPLETCLRLMSEGLQLHRALLTTISSRLENKDKVTQLLNNIRDLVIQLNKILKKVQADAVVQPSPTPMALNLPGDYEVQVATHLTLVQLQDFGLDVARTLRALDQSSDEEMES